LSIDPYNKISWQVRSEKGVQEVIFEARKGGKTLSTKVLLKDTGRRRNYSI